ncbi:hypothetical protein GO684_00145 [Wolbachia endosymbiont of Litomosoides brasiliensis]|uniref:hypothetical protein n=1 Tax=Wolbachia endosymbiont of Litomosoides brasiliensis TaxID=1812117 RepID=UPI00158C1C5E|nr:hypothetical protein [Wolbachia endosymbiont of Litomosoides brasiliensis]NUY39169.1 hypothetical protein [Wolbachia endosymbiont of Litomosoides brasiliensis]
MTKDLANDNLLNLTELNLHGNNIGGKLASKAILTLLERNVIEKWKRGILE